MQEYTYKTVATETKRIKTPNFRMRIITNNNIIFQKIHDTAPIHFH